MTVPRVRGILETSLYVEDLSRSSRFYRTLFGFEELVREERLCALGVGDRQVLLLFRRGSSAHPSDSPGGTVPGHDARGEMHMAFAVALEDLDLWQERLRENGIAVESLVHWPHGGMSIYFRDPDNHSIELASPGTWPIY